MEAFDIGNCAIAQVAARVNGQRAVSATTAELVYFVRGVYIIRVLFGERLAHYELGARSPERKRSGKSSRVAYSATGKIVISLADRSFLLQTACLLPWKRDRSITCRSPTTTKLAAYTF